MDRGLGFGAVGHLNKPESPRISGKLVCDDFDGCDLAEGLESLPQIFFSGLLRQIAYINIHSDILYWILLRGGI